LCAQGNLCSKLLHNCAVGPRSRESAHVFKITGGITGKFRKLALEIAGQAIDDLRAPTLPFLIGKNLPADLPVMQDQFGIRSQRRLQLETSLPKRAARRWSWRRKTSRSLRLRGGLWRLV